MAGKKRIYISEEELSYMLYDEHKSISKIAAELGVSKHTVSARMKEYGLKTRREHNEKHINKELLEQLYVNEKKSIKRLSKELGCGRDWLREQLIEYGFLIPMEPITDRPELTYDLLDKMYNIDEKSLVNIAKELGYGIRPVKRAFRQYGFKTRKQIKCGDDVHSHQKHFNYAITDGDELKTLVNAGKSVSDISLYYDCSTSVVYSALKRYNLEIQRPIELTKTQLYKLYIEDQLGIETIAKITGWSSGTIRNRLIEYNILLRSANELQIVDVDIDRLKELLTLGYSYAAAGKELGCSWAVARARALENGFNDLNEPRFSQEEIAMIELLRTNNVEFSTHNRKIISPQEIDIVINDDIGIEICPCFTHHSSNDPSYPYKVKDVNYHINKRKVCDDTGIQLITKFDWHSNELILFFIKRQLGLLKEVDDIDIIETNERDCDKQLVSINKNNNAYHVKRCVMFTGRVDGNTVLEVEIIGYEPGVWSVQDVKLNLSYDVLKHLRNVFEVFRQEYSPSEIIFDVNRNLFEKDFGENIGFNFSRELEPKLKYVHKKGNKWYTPDEIDQALDLSDLMERVEKEKAYIERYFYKVYDCGWTRYIWSKFK